MKTSEFIRLAERISGQDLDQLFQDWLYTPGKPALPESALRSAPQTERQGPPPVGAKLLIARMKNEMR